MDILADINRISNELISSFEPYTVNESGKVLKFQIRDEQSKMNLNLFSRNKQVRLTDEFIDYLQNNPDVEFRLA